MSDFFSRLLNIPTEDELNDLDSLFNEDEFEMLPLQSECNVG